MSAQPIGGHELDRGHVARLAAHELAGAIVGLERVLEIAHDASSEGTNGYKLDAYERRELRDELARFDAWAKRNEQLLAWARKAHRKSRPRGGAGRW